MKSRNPLVSDQCISVHGLTTEEGAARRPVRVKRNFPHLGDGAYTVDGGGSANVGTAPRPTLDETGVGQTTSDRPRRRTNMARDYLRDIS